MSELQGVRVHRPHGPAEAAEAGGADPTQCAQVRRHLGPWNLPSPQAGPDGQLLCGLPGRGLSAAWGDGGVSACPLPCAQLGCVGSAPKPPQPATEGLGVKPIPMASLGVGDVACSGSQNAGTPKLTWSLCVRPGCVYARVPVS